MRGRDLTGNPKTMRGRYRGALKVQHYAKYRARFYAK
jgi:hypothetical protein